MESKTGRGVKIMEIIYHYRLNKNSFSQKIGLPSNSLISRVTLDPETDISLEVAEKILTVFREVSADWFLLDKGPMIRSKLLEPVTHTIGYYKGGKDPVDLMKISGYDDCTHAFDVIGDSMSPKYQTGDIVICMEIEPAKVSYGEAYMLYINNRPVIRFVKKDEQGSLKLTAQNSRYDEMVVKEREIEKLYLIKGVIRREVI